MLDVHLPRVIVTTTPLVPAHIAQAVSHSGAGAVVLFTGMVRDSNDGHAVVLLEYEAYESMALAEITRICREIEEELPGVRLAAHHRVGSLSVGEAAVVCAASAAHRREAFEACSRAIDRIKHRVPVWKREHGPDGPHWVGWRDARCTHGDES